MQPGSGEADERDQIADERDRIADERDRIADERERIADERERIADERERAADDTEADLTARAPSSAQAILDALSANAKEREANAGDQVDQRSRSQSAAAARGGAWELDKRDFVADDRQHQADLREVVAEERDRIADLREDILRELAAAVPSDAGAAPHLLFAAEGRAARATARTARQEAQQARHEADVARALSRRSGFASELVAVARALVHADTIDGALDEIVNAARHTVGVCDAATFSMVAPKRDVSTAASADPGGFALAFEQAQYAAKQGPALRALEARAVITTPDVTAETQWRAAVERVPDTPVRSVLCVPVVEERRSLVLGSMNHYSTAVNAFTDDDAEVAVLLAAHLGAVLALALDAAAAGRRVIELGHAVQTRDVIGQAKGILMERQRLSADQAFDVLRGASQRLNRKLIDVADDLATAGAIMTEPT